MSSNLDGGRINTMYRISVRAIIEHDGKFLLVKHRADSTFWCLPGGGLEEGENVLSALERELIEETHVKPVIGNLIYIHQVKQDDGYTAPGLYFHIKNAEDYLNHNIYDSSHGKHEIAEIDWFDITKVTVLPKFLATELPDISKNGFNIPARVKFD